MFVSVYMYTPQSKLHCNGILSGIPPSFTMLAYLEAGLQPLPLSEYIISSLRMYKHKVYLTGYATSTCMQHVYAGTCIYVYSYCVYTAIGSNMYKYSTTNDYLSLPMPGRTCQTGHTCSSSHLVAQSLSVVSSPHITEASQTLLYNWGAAFSMS